MSKGAKIIKKSACFSCFAFKSINFAQILKTFAQTCVLSSSTFRSSGASIYWKWLFRLRGDIQKRVTFCMEFFCCWNFLFCLVCKNDNKWSKCILTKIHSFAKKLLAEILSLDKSYIDRYVFLPKQIIGRYGQMQDSLQLQILLFTKPFSASAVTQKTSSVFTEITSL